MYIYDNDVPAAGTFPWSTCGVYIPCIVLWRVEEAKRKRRYVQDMIRYKKKKKENNIDLILCVCVCVKSSIGETGRARAEPRRRRRKDREPRAREHPRGQESTSGRLPLR